MENNREAGYKRIYPKIYEPRFYYFLQLRKVIELIIKNHIKGKNYPKLVDYGCGNTPYKPFFEKHVNEYIGADLGVNTNATIQLKPEGQIPLENESVDVILSTQVLEHVDNPHLYLTESARVLKKEGRLIITTHGYWMYHPDPQDFWRWTSAGLKKTIVEAGFEIVDFTGIIGRSAMGLQLFQDGILPKIPKFLWPVLSLVMQVAIMIFDQTSSQTSRNNDACTFIVVAKPVKK